MTDAELRGLVREAIARHMAGGQADSPTLPAAESHRLHLSHATFALTRGSDDDGACVIEPSVRCNHCGYCVSYGH
jgi:hypothetical protein